MHGSAGLHSAIAIKRQRRLREQAKKRAAERERRLSSRTNSLDSIDHFHPQKLREDRHDGRGRSVPDHRLATSIGMLHLGVCFLVLGLFLIGSGLLPDDMVTWRSGGWWNELVATGIFVVALGLFLIALNRVMSKREEDDLNDYVSKQLTRSRSGHRLERDVETGGLTTKHHRRSIEAKRRREHEVEEEEARSRGGSDGDGEQLVVTTPTLSSSPQTVQVALGVDPTTTTTIIQNGDAYLEKIIEEDPYERIDDDLRHLELKETMSNTTTASLSPGTPSETKELISNNARQYSFNSRQY